ncbi:hypothetical protein, variant 1 [Aphanomyces astaci]|uniref:Centrosomal protein POC5 n=1 Tax=Aphanomyces astaci TaxID=112090 RepID=W4H417_APHAT|nr:hypothetical protein, variant 1 [Aphanomyces astaci]ETV86617.1 hypothetical protein, variant 1 [Aphanomyces astaci]|eukprot:XP_009823419.1 hypothetical protein, variant 1 [Aphanomyces astaci]
MTSDGSDAAAVLSLRSHLAAIDLLEKDGLEEEPSLTRAYASKPTDSGNDDSFHRDSGSDVSRVDTRESLRATEVLVFPPSNEATLFSSMMEQHHTAMVQTTLALFDDLQTRLRNDHDRQINSQAAVAVEREAHAQNSLAALRTTLDDMTNRVKVQKLMLLRLATHHATKSHLHDRHFGSPQSLLRILHAWHLYSRQRMFKELRLRQAQTLHRQRMPRRPFEAWRRYTQSLQRARQVEHSRVHHEMAIDTLQDQHVADLQALRDELARAHTEIEVYQLEQVRLEEDVRRVFLRGVSAMNLEALSLFRHNPVHQPTPRHETGDDEGTLYKSNP